MNEEKRAARQEQPCGLPKSANNCTLHSLESCRKCGWNPDECARRTALPFSRDETGRRYKDVTQK